MSVSPPPGSMRCLSTRQLANAVCPRADLLKVMLLNHRDPTGRGGGGGISVIAC